MEHEKASMIKITRPSIKGVFPRERLFRLLDKERKRPVIWVSGPPGSGKTTLIASYLDVRKMPSLWYQVDKGDADIATFFYYMGLAAKHVPFPETGKAAPRKRVGLPLLTPEYLGGISVFTKRYFEDLYRHLPLTPTLSRQGRGEMEVSLSPQGRGEMEDSLSRRRRRKKRISPSSPLRLRGNPPSSPLNLRGERGGLQGGKGGFFIVFDNYHHVLPESQFHDVIREGLSIIPEDINVIVISRSDPPPSIAPLRAAGKIDFVGWDQLKFTLEESRKVIRLGAKKRLSDDIMKELHRKTQGWVAGLVLITEMSRTEGIEPKTLNKIIPNEIFHYFAGEVFNKMDDETKDFLLKTSFLPKMTPLMAEKLTGITNAAEILSRLNSNHYFTARHSHPEPVYQYHLLFREFLQYRARDSFKPEEIDRIRRTSAEVLAESEQIEDAASLFRSAGDWTGLIRLILSHAPSLIEQGRSKTLEEWIVSIPEKITQENPWLLFWLGMCCQSYDLTESRLHFEKAFQSFEASKDRTGMLISWAGIAFSLAYSFEDIKALDRWIDVLDNLMRDSGAFPSEEIELRVLPVVFFAAIDQSEYRNLDAYIERALHLARHSKHIEMKIQLLSNLASYLMVRRGRIQEAAVIVDMIRHLARAKEISPLSRISTKLSEALLGAFSGGQKECIEAVSDGLELAEGTGIRILDGKLLIQGVLCALNTGDTGTARRLLERMASSLATLDRYDSTAYRILIAFEALYQNRIEEASVNIDASLTSFEEIGHPVALAINYSACAQIMYASGKHREAAACLERALGIADGIRADHLKSSCLLVKAHFAFSVGDEKTGLQLLGEALALGRAQGNYLTFVWQPSVKAELCARALDANIEVDYVQELIRRCHLTPPLPHPPPRGGREGVGVENWPYPLKIYTLGRFEILKEGTPLSFSGKVQQKPLSMLKALIAFGGREIPAEQLIDALWADAEGDLAYKSFEMTLIRLRRLTGMDKAIRLKENRVTLDPRYCWVDVTVLEYLFKQAEESWNAYEQSAAGSIHSEEVLAEAIRLTGKVIDIYKGHFLPFDTEQSWAMSKREHLKRRYLHTIVMLGKYYERAGQWEKARGYFEKGLETDDLAEDLYQHLMVCHQRLGQKAEAVKVYNRCRSALSESLGIEPSSRTEELKAEVLK